MAIVIPSKNIHGKEVSQVRDDVIDSIELNAKVTKDNFRYNENVASVSIGSGFQNNPKKTTYYNFDGNIIHFASLRTKYLLNFEIFIPASNNNSTITKIYNGKNEENEPNIKHSVSFYKNTYDYEFSSLTENGAFGISQKHLISQSEGEGVLSPYLNAYEIAKEDKYGFNKENIELSEANLTNLSSVSVELLKKTNQYYLSVTVLSGLTQEVDIGRVIDGVTYPILGRIVEYIPKTVSIFLYGNIYTLSLEELTKKYNDGESVFSITGNELFRNENTITNPAKIIITKEVPVLVNYVPKGSNYFFQVLEGQVFAGNEIVINGRSFIVEETTNEVGDIEKYFFGFYENIVIGQEYKANNIENQLDFMAKNILKAYMKGKETATITCSINDYYDENGNKVIAIDNSTNKMLFEVFDEVIPMGYSASRIDEPMSVNPDGTPKVFQVISVEPFDDGVVMQKISLIEI